jgi:hypothetical protein
MQHGARTSQSPAHLSASLPPARPPAALPAVHRLLLADHSITRPPNSLSCIPIRARRRPIRTHGRPIAGVAESRFTRRDPAEARLCHRHHTAAATAAPPWGPSHGCRFVTARNLGRATHTTADRNPLTLRHRTEIGPNQAASKVLPLGRAPTLGLPSSMRIT